MSEPATQQEAETVQVGVVWTVGLGVIVLTAVVVAIAWLLVEPPPAPQPAGAPAHGLFDRASVGRR